MSIFDQDITITKEALLGTGWKYMPNCSALVKYLTPRINRVYIPEWIVEYHPYNPNKNIIVKTTDHTRDKKNRQKITSYKIDTLFDLNVLIYDLQNMLFEVVKDEYRWFPEENIQYIKSLIMKNNRQ